MDGLVVILFILFAAAVIGLAIWSAREAKKRREALGAWCAARGYSFDPEYDYSFDHHYPEFACFQQGSRRYAYDILRGEHHGRPFCGFDYHYETYSQDSKGKRQTHHHHFSAVVVEAHLPLKPLAIRGEGFFDKLGEFLGLDDIDFESAEFSREFHVTSPDRRWAFDVLHQQAMEFLLSSPRFTLEFQRGRALVWRGEAFSANEFQAALDVVTGLLDRLPKSVVRELHETP